MAEHAHTTPTPIARRRRAAPAQAGVDPRPEETTPNPDLDPTKVRARRATNHRNEKLPAAQVGNVVSIPKRLTGVEAIVAEVTGASKRQNDSLLERMQEITVILRARQLERANELIPLAMKMDRPMVDDLVEIAQRMLAARGRL